MRDNPKFKGELGQAITIGELAKFEIQCALPMSDNLPFDIIVIYKDRLYKAQIKTSSYHTPGTNGSIAFNLNTNNWHKKTIRKYTKKDTDIMILCDYHTIYLLKKEDFIGRKSFSIRTETSKNKQRSNCNAAIDYSISVKRLEEVFQ